MLRRKEHLLAMVEYTRIAYPVGSRQWNKGIAVPAEVKVIRRYGASLAQETDPHNIAQAF
ncbi:hypothetical protein D3C72_2255420 [compost metagenome]